MSKRSLVQNSGCTWKQYKHSKRGNLLTTSPRPELIPGEWIYICCECLIEPRNGIVLEITYKCECCGNSNLRFIHILAHMNNRDQQIQVGIECARRLVAPEARKIPQLAEIETKRKERWRRDVYSKPGSCFTTISDLEKRGKL